MRIIKMKKVILIILVGIIGLVGLLLLLMFKPNARTIDDFTGEIKTFDIIAKSWEFIPSIIEVNKGDKVILDIESIDVAHGVSISEFGVREYLNPGKSITVEFIADKSGEFTFFCNVYCGDGHGNMRGRLIVN